MRSPRTQLDSSPHLPKLEKGPASNKDPVWPHSQNICVCVCVCVCVSFDIPEREDKSVMTGWSADEWIPELEAGRG